MSDERIKQLMAQTPLPESLSTYQAFKQLQNEMQQEINRLTAELAECKRIAAEKTVERARLADELAEAHALSESRARTGISYKQQAERYCDALVRVYRGDGRINPTVTDLMYIAREALSCSDGATTLEAGE